MKPVEILCPVKGTWSFMNTPGHHPDAKDFVAVDNWGRPYKTFRFVLHLFYRLNVIDTYAWSKPVLAPFGGHIIEAKQDRTDRMALNLFRDLFVGLVIAPRRHRSDPQFFFGNYIIIKSEEGVYALLAHLKKGSIAVKEGMQIKAGQPLAEIGNSGNTIQPHLHFHLMSENEPYTSIPRPFVLKTFEIRKRTGWIKEHLSLPGNFKMFRMP